MGINMTSSKVEKILIVGGGTSGWMCASYLAKTFGSDVEITLLEAPGIPRIGVGEATVPNLQKVFFDHLGIPESVWMKECNGSFKMAVKFVNWRTPGAGQATPRQLPDGSRDAFYHPFGILPTTEQLPMSAYWLDRSLRGGTSEPFDQSCFVESGLMDRNRAPHDASGAPKAIYAWHFDAQLLADFLRDYSVKHLSVRHILEAVKDVRVDEDGYISSIVTENDSEFTADLFIDCTGFKGLLINQALGEPFLDQSDYLLCDRALAAQLPYADEETELEPYTSAIAMSSGWAWKTPLLGRFGTGYVYASNFIDEDSARIEFASLWGQKPDFCRPLRFRVGRNDRSWVKNCVSIGLSSCFLEPLESSGLYFTYAAIYQLAKHFPSKAMEAGLAESFNSAISTMFDETRDFLQAHYYYAPRTDTQFWRQNHELTLSPDFKRKMSKYDVGLPVSPPTASEDQYYSDFDVEFENFWTNGSYYAILTGLGHFPSHVLPRLRHQNARDIQSEWMFERVRSQRAELESELPSLAAYLRSFHGLTTSA